MGIHWESDLGDKLELREVHMIDYKEGMVVENLRANDWEKNGSISWR